MLHFLNRRKPAPPTAIPPSHHPEDLGAVAGADIPQMPTPMLASNMLFCILKRLARTDQFQGAFDTHPDFHAEMMPDALEITKHQVFLAGGLVDQNTVTLSYAGVTGPHLAKLGVDVVMENLFDISPDWQIDEAGNSATRLPFGPPKHWMTIECITQPVDPWFAGQMVDGATLRIAMIEET